MKFIEEPNSLLKIKLFVQGPNQWRFYPTQQRNGKKIRKGEIIYRGSDEKLKLLLKRLRAKDNATDPPAKNGTYQQMIDSARNGSDPFIWVELQHWKNYRRDNNITLGEKEYGLGNDLVSLDPTGVDINQVLNILRKNDVDVKHNSNVDIIVDKGAGEYTVDILNLNGIKASYVQDSYYEKDEKQMKKIKEKIASGAKELLAYFGSKGFQQLNSNAVAYDIVEKGIGYSIEISTGGSVYTTVTTNDYIEYVKDLRVTSVEEADQIVDEMLNMFSRFRNPQDLIKMGFEELSESIKYKVNNNITEVITLTKSLKIGKYLLEQGDQIRIIK